MILRISLIAALVLSGSLGIAADEEPRKVGPSPIKISTSLDDLDLSLVRARKPIARTDKSPEDRSAGDDVVELYPQDGEEWLKDPFLVLDMEMEAVVADFGDGRPKPPAETTQPRIVNRFDTLIEMLEKSCNGTGPGGNNPIKPAQASVIRKGPGGMGELTAPKKNGKGYEDLTPKEREKILQSKTEGFPPGFEDVLADYFRRLSKAEESSATPPTEEKTGSE
jgi:hypothetical protein